MSLVVEEGLGEGDLHCHCQKSVHQFYTNILVFVNINPFLYINDQFALEYQNWGYSIKKNNRHTTVAVHLEKFWGHGSHFKCGVANILKLKLAFFIDVCPAAAPETTSWIVRMFQIYLPKQDSRGGRSRYNDPLWDNYPHLSLFASF